MKILLIISGVIAIILLVLAVKYYRKKKKSHRIRLTMKAIIRWEQINKKSFSQLNYSSEGDILSLFYACTLCDQINVSLDEFKNTLTKSSIKRMIHEFEKQTSFVSQFQAESKKKGDKAESSEPIYIKNIVAKLVMNGLDVYYAMNKMELCDIPVFLEAYDQNVKDKLESQRLGIFWMLRPHVSSKIKNPKDLYEFTWDEEKAESITQTQWDQAEQIVKSMKCN